MSTQTPGYADHPTPPVQRTFLGHPVGLYVLFFTEMWERFSYYGMRAILILYMVKYYKMAQEDASSIYKWYTSLVYLTPILGGFLADRFLGNKRAVLIGAVLMAAGQFLLSFSPRTAFFAGLVFLILGNGFFKPNMSTQVGRLYPPNDPRRDGAYTIFYMGINLGAFLSPLVCGWLAENTTWEYHAGFVAAGVGMVLGLLVYVFGLPWVHELPQGEPGPAQGPPPPDADAHAVKESPETIKAAAHLTATPPAPVLTPEPESAPDVSAPISDAQAERTPSAIPTLSRLAPYLLLGTGALLAVAGPVLALLKWVAWDSAVGIEIAAFCALLSAWITAKVRQAARDRVLAIYVLGVFVVCFWAAAEQAGNALNLWADQTTNRYLTEPAPPVPLPPEEQPRVGGWLSFLNPVPTAWFQSINALAVFALAPVFAFLWTWLDRRRLNPPTALKMAIGVFLMAVSFALMIASARYEDRPTRVTVAATQLPAGVEEDGGRLRPQTTAGEDPGPFYQAGRLTWDRDTHSLHMRGVLPDTERDRIVRDTAPQEFKDLAEVLRLVTPKLGKERRTVEVKLDRKLTIRPRDWFPGSEVRYDADAKTLAMTAALPLKVHLAVPPAGFDLRLAGFKKDEATYDPKTHDLTVNQELADREIKGLLVAAGEPIFRTAVFQLYSASAAFRVSPWWLFWVYVLGTLGELCLSPVGLSMVSKLAPAKFATMLMGLWLLTSFFGNFIAGALGEHYDKLPPSEYFLYITLALLAATAVLLVLIRVVVAMMHGVK
jgi:proton-dependent oligopeptide transporter, POT family